MRVVALEEHVVFPELTKRIDPALIRGRGFPQPGTPAAAHLPSRELADLGADRLTSMDAGGIAVQVLSLSGPGADLLGAAQSPELARAFNDHLAGAIEQHPSRYAGFAHLPMTAPEAAADELERTVRELGFGRISGGEDWSHLRLRGSTQRRGLCLKRAGVSRLLIPRRV